MELETQVAKILIENPKTANAYVFSVAEKSFDAETELYAVIELPVFNPAATAECERIAKAVAASLKRSYRRTPNENTFESALSQINEELAKLASLGQTHWIGKLNALVAAKTGQIFNIATTGKVSALLFRDGEFTNISDSPKNPHPLKTFENFAAGKLKLHDFLILSTPQLFNYLSIDRLKNILSENTLPLAGQRIIHILQDNAGPEVAFGTLITLQVEPGTTPDETIDLEEFTAPSGKESTFIKKVRVAALSAGKSALSATGGLGQIISKKFKQAPKLTLSNLNVKNLVDTNKKAWSKMKGGVQSAKSTMNVNTFRRFSFQKKFFFIATLILFLTVLVSVTMSYKHNKTAETENQFKTLIADMNKLINDANGALLYRADQEAQNIINQLQEKSGGLNEVPEDLKDDADRIKQQLAELINKVENVTRVNASTVATLGNSDSLIKLPNIIAIESNRTIVSYNKNNGSVQDGTLVSAEPIITSEYIKGNQTVVYNGQNLYLWDFSSNILSPGFSENVPNDKAAVGLKLYSTNNRVYTLDTKNNRILSFQVGDKAISKPVVSVNSTDALSGALDLAIDGSIYVLKPGSVVKFNSGQPADFSLPALAKPVGSHGKIYTSIGVVNLYILDPDNKRIIVLDKKGNVVKTLTSDQFTNLKDFVVDEKGKTMFVLNDTSLLKFSF